jgi:hypothetical protein
MAEAFGADVRWDEDTKSVHIYSIPRGDPVRTTIQAVLAKPLTARDQPVMIEGEYRGWHGSAIGHGTRHGPPTTRKDWVIRDATGELYVSAQEPIEAPFKLQPLSNLGRLVTVTGWVALAEKGFPYLRPLTITAREGPICAVKMPRDTFPLGQPVDLTLIVGNPGNTPLDLTFTSGKQHDFVVRDAAGQELWRWSADKAFTQMIQRVTWPPGFSAEIAATWDQTLRGGGPPLREGLYQVVGEVKAQNLPLSSFPQRFELTAESKE